jgi:hypothetical protein
MYNKFPSTSNAVVKAAARKAVNAAGFGKVNTAYAGQNAGLSLEDVKRLVDVAPKVVGTTFTSAAGTVTPNVQIPSTAKYMIGFIFAGAPNAADSFDMLINEERAIDTGSVQAFQAAVGKPDIGYYEFMRPVAGATAINLNYNSLVAGNAILFQIVYI